MQPYLLVCGMCDKHTIWKSNIMVKRHLKSAAMLIASTVTSAVLVSPTYADTLNSVLDVGQQKIAAGKKSQGKVDRLSDQTYQRLQDYKTVNKQIDGLRVYNEQLEKQITNQLRQIKEIGVSIGQVSVMERQMTPLILRMIDGLEQLVGLDVPFLKEERSDRIDFLRASFDRADVSVAEKFRQVLEAYKIEGEYGRKISNYKDTIDIEGVPREVNILRVGRIALLYQTTDMAVTGAWDQKNREWVELDPADYRSAVKKGLRISNKQASTDIMKLPIAAPESVQ